MRYTTGQSVEVKRLHPDATLPTFGSAGAAGLDLYAVEDTVIKQGECVPVRTGIALNMMGVVNLAVVVIPRSGLGAKKALILGNSVALIDNDYQGEIMCYMFLEPRKDTAPMHIIKKGERFAQLMFLEFAVPVLREVEAFNTETERGAGGFGSTGG